MDRTILLRVKFLKNEYLKFRENNVANDRE